MVGSMADLHAVFTELRQVLSDRASSLVVLRNEPGDFQMETTKPGPSGGPMWFGAVQIRRRYVSFHLMPVYSHPDLLDGASGPLRARMQGKSCFNFTPRTATPELVAELSALVDAGLARYRAEGLA